MSDDIFLAILRFLSVIAAIGWAVVISKKIGDIDRKLNELLKSRKDDTDE